MPTLTESDTRATVAANREQRYNDAEFASMVEYDRRRRDEITDQAERLAAPMANGFDYELRPEGLTTDLGERILPVIEDGYKVARHQAERDPRWQFELSRRAIELEEQQQIEAFARHYGSGVRITSLSLDQSDYEGIRAIAQKLGHQLPSERMASEDILKNRMWLSVPPSLVVLSPIPDAVRVNGVDIGAYDRSRNKMLVRIVTLTNRADAKKEHDNLIDLVRDTYDAKLAELKGGEWYAGRKKIGITDAQAFIESHPELLNEHMEIMTEVFAKTADPAERNRLLEPHRYNLAAALDKKLNGEEVTSLADAGANARAEGKEFTGDCPTVATATTAAEQLELLGYKVPQAVEFLHCVNCPFCKKMVTAKKVNTSREKSIECQSCYEKVDLETGERISGKAKKVAKKIGAFVRKQAAKVPQKLRPKKPRNGDIVVIGGRELRYTERLVIGGTVSEYVDPASGKKAAAPQHAQK